MSNPSENLLDQQLDGGWVVIEKIKSAVNGTGGNFSVCYKVRRNGQIAFMKAMDLSRAMQHKNSLEVLHALTAKHVHETTLLQACADRKMDKIVTILDSGQVIPQNNNPGNYPVPYLIFELAERTIRDHVLTDETIKIDNACLMRSLHNVAVAIRQLHSADIAHQDIKGSNVLMFDGAGNSKVSDLGSAEIAGRQSVHTNLFIAGDPTYAPPELLYRYVHPDFDVRRKATDLYHLGSLVCFYYTKDAMTPLLKTFIPLQYCWVNQPGTYDVALPYVRYAFGQALDYLEECLENQFSEKQTVNDIINLVAYLCDPDPLMRGHPENRMSPKTRYSMIRFITDFDVLANRFEAKQI